MAKKMHLLIINKNVLVKGLLGAGVCFALLFLASSFFSEDFETVFGQNNKEYTILAANDLGMHCYHSDYSSFLLLPPGNTLKVQVIKKGPDRAEVVNKGIEVSYEIPGNTTSADKINFWQYAKDYGYNVEPDIGVTGNGLKGTCKLSEDGKYYEATFIPLTPYADGSRERNPYQLARITVKDSKTGKTLASADNVVVPVSDEMGCSTCHGKDQTEESILKSHDKLSGTGLITDLEKGIRHKCAECHQDAALGMQGQAGVLSLSEAMHSFHAPKMTMSTTTPNCYTCHPGPDTNCNRGFMASIGYSCDNANCHGDMANVGASIANGRKPWLEEPDCGNCHGATYAANANTLYRNSYLQNGPAAAMNNLIQCESCHNSPHAEWVSSLPADNLLPQSLLG